MNKKVLSLQTLRAIAFILVFCSHCTFISIFPSTWGAVGVSVFIILSGFVTALKYNKYEENEIENNPVPYVVKRLRQIFPLHILVLIIRLVFDWSHGITTKWWVIFLNITMLKSFVPIQDVYYSLGGVTWYLTLVLFFAFLTPFFLKIITKLQPFRHWLFTFVAILIFRIIWIYAWHLSEHSLWLNYVNPFFRSTDYFLGMMLGNKINVLIEFVKGHRKTEYFLLIFPWGILGIYMLSLSLGTLPWYNIYLRTPLSILLIFSCMLAEQVQNYYKSIFYDNKLLIYLGNISFEMYLIHIQVKYIISYKFYEFGIHNNLLELFLIVLLTVLSSQLYINIKNTVKREIN